MMGRKHKILLWGIISTVMISVFGVVVDGDASALTYSSQHDIQFTFNSVISINLSSPNLVISDLAPGEYSDSNIITVGANTNASMGYQLSATVGQKNGTDALVNTTSSSNTFANLTTTQATLAGFSDNTWGYSYCADTSTNCSSSGSATWVSGSKGSTTAGYAGLPLDNNANASDRGMGGVLLLNTSGPEDTVQSVQFKIGAKASNNQASGDYTNTINFYAVANPEPQLGPVSCTAGKICYNVNSLTATEGTMGMQSASDGNTVTLLASNFSRNNYGFAGWNTAYDYSGTFYGPNEDIVVPTGTTANGLSLYAVWVRSAGSMQVSASRVCSSLSAAAYNDEGDSDESTWSIDAGLSSTSALTDTRDNQTYAIAKLSDSNCWMIENLRLDDTAELTIENTNNPLNDGTNVTLKHIFNDTLTYNTLSATSNVAYDATSAPNGWPSSSSSSSYVNQSRLRTDNVASRASYMPDANISADANLYSYGNYYNWYSATAGRGTYSSGANVTTVGDLCPSGWHLPYGGSGTGVKGGNTTGGFYYFANSMTAATNNSINSRKFRVFPNNFIYSGYVSGASMNGRGSFGRYWTSSATSSSSANEMFISDLSAAPGNNTGKSSGEMIRCVISGT